MRQITYYLLFIIILCSCKNKIDCEITGFAYTNIGTPAKDIEIKDLIKFSPRDFHLETIPINYDKKSGEFKFKIEKNKTKGDNKYYIYILTRRD